MSSHTEPAPAMSRAPPASAKTAQQVGAGLLATATGFGADAAVLMHVPDQRKASDWDVRTDPTS
jgi:hypothetical protein